MYISNEAFDLYKKIVEHNLTTNKPEALFLEYSAKPIHPLDSFESFVFFLKSIAKSAGHLVTTHKVHMIASACLFPLFVATTYFLTSVKLTPISASLFVAALLYVFNFVSVIRKIIDSTEPFKITYTIQSESTLRSDDPSFANQSNDHFVTDPISGTEMKREWIDAPRFIKLGTYILPIHSLIPALFRNPLKDGKIIHPIETGRVLNDVEQEKLLADLSRLFTCTKESFLKILDPISGIQTDGASTEDIQNSFIDKFLSSRVQNWKELSYAAQCELRIHHKDRILEVLRICTFLKTQEEFRDIPLRDNDDDASDPPTFRALKRQLEAN